MNKACFKMQVNKEGGYKVKTLTYLQSNIQSTTDESCCSEHNRMSTEKILTNIKGDVLKNKSKIDVLPYHQEKS